MLVTSHSRAVDYLRHVAESSDSTAADALELLMTDAGGAVADFLAEWIQRYRSEHPSGDSL